MKKIRILFLFILLGSFALTNIYSQSTQESEKTEKKKIIIIKKTVDENGNVNVERVEKEMPADMIGENDLIEVNVGDDDTDVKVFKKRKMLKRDKAEGASEMENKKVIIKKITDENGNVNVEKIVEDYAGEGSDKHIEVEVETDDAGGIKVIKRRLGENGEVETEDVQWMQHSYDIDIDEDGDDKHIILKMKDGDNPEEVIEWRGTGEIPEHVRKHMHHFKGEDGEHGFYFHNIDIQRDIDDYPCDVLLGVHVTASDNINGGVPVNGIIGKSPAEKSNMQKADIITAISGEEINNYADLRRVLLAHGQGADVEVTYTRDGEQHQVATTLRTCTEEDQQNHFDFDFDFLLPENFCDVNTFEKKRKIIIMKSEDVKEESPIEEPAIEENAEEREQPVQKTEPQQVNISPNQLQLQNFTAFPNPTQGKVNVRFEGPAAPTNITITDIAGKEVYAERITDFDGNYNKEIDLSNVSAGTVLLTVSQDDKLYTQKIIVGAM